MLSLFLYIWVLDLFKNYFDNSLQLSSPSSIELDRLDFWDNWDCDPTDLKTKEVVLWVYILISSGLNSSTQTKKGDRSLVWKTLLSFIGMWSTAKFLIESLVGVIEIMYLLLTNGI